MRATCFDQIAYAWRLANAEISVRTISPRVRSVDIFRPGAKRRLIRTSMTHAS
jgi:hypothetical protein